MNQKKSLKKTAPTSDKSGASTQESNTETPEMSPAKTEVRKVEIDNVVTRNPITGKPMSVQIEKREKLTPEQMTERTLATLKEHGINAQDKVQIQDPITKEIKTITLDRTGHNETKVIMALADPKLSREQRDYALSMYLFERGAENTSFMVDLMSFKGNYTREGRAFQSQMRFDFTTFVDSFTNYLDTQARLLGITLGFDVSNERKEFTQWLEEKNKEEQKKWEKNKGYEKQIYTFRDFYVLKRKGELTRGALMEMAIYADEQAQKLRGAIEQITRARMAQKGHGFYVDHSGKIINTNDPALEEIIKAEREALEKENAE